MKGMALMTLGEPDCLINRIRVKIRIIQIGIMCYFRVFCSFYHEWRFEEDTDCGDGEL